MLLVLNRNIIWRFILAGAVIFTVGNIHAQRRFFDGRSEIGAHAGVSGYNGDLSHSFDAKSLHLAGGLYYKYTMNSFFSYRLQASYLKIQGTDEGDPTYGLRNLTFQTSILELGNMFEFNFQPFGTNTHDKTWSPYFLTGLNAFWFDPTRLENTDINLRNLRTERQKNKYSRLQPSIPIGFGIKAISLRRRKGEGVWIFGLEGCWRKTFTDNLDDVNRSYPDYQTMVDKQNITSAQYSHAQTLNGNPSFNSNTMRGDTHLKDWYYSFALTLAFRIHAGSCPEMR